MVDSRAPSSEAIEGLEAGGRLFGLVPFCFFGTMKGIRFRTAGAVGSRACKPAYPAPCFCEGWLAEKKTLSSRPVP